MSQASTVYVGGIGQQTTDTILYSAFATFGDIISVQLPIDQGKRFEENPPHRGFGFVEFASAADAWDAVDNMHLNRVNGDTVKCNITKQRAGEEKLGSNKAVWEDEAWLQQHSGIDKNADVNMGEQP